MAEFWCLTIRCKRLQTSATNASFRLDFNGQKILGEKTVFISGNPTISASIEAEGKAEM
jgi:hypothetical protein